MSENCLKSCFNCSYVIYVCVSLCVFECAFCIHIKIIPWILLQKKLQEAVKHLTLVLT